MGKFNWGTHKITDSEVFLAGYDTFNDLVPLKNIVQKLLNQIMKISLSRIGLLLKKLNNIFKTSTHFVVMEMI